jgi:hypothetical protein
MPVKKSVAIEVDAMLTRLFPIKIVDRTTSYSSANFKVRCTLLLFSLLIDFSLTLLSDEKAVSAEEKKAENSIITIIIINKTVLLIFSPLISIKRLKRAYR